MNLRYLAAPDRSKRLSGHSPAARGYPAAWLGAAVAMLLAAGLMLVARSLLPPHPPSIKESFTPESGRSG